MRLAELTTTDAADALGADTVALLPTGSTEQHGPALPLSTDALTAETVATRLDVDDVVVLPTLPVGVSEHHRQFDGTLWLAPDTYESAVYDILASVASHGVRKVVIVNGHGGNAGANRRAARRLRTDQTAFVAPWNWWDGVPDDVSEALFDEAGGHADAAESSVVLHLREDLVDPDALEAAESGGSEGWGHDVAGADVGFDTIDFSTSGATGRPTAATSDAGRQLLDAAGESLATLVDWIAAQPLDSLWPAAHK